MSTDVGVQVSSSAPRRRGLRIVRDDVFFFKETPSLILSVAPPFKIESASLGFDFDTEAWWSRPQQPEHDAADFESFATAFSFSKKRRLSFSPSLLLSKSNPLRWASILIQRRGGAALSNRNTMSRTSNRSRRRFLFQRNAAFVHGQGRRFFR